jgi:hypothetical protein
MGSLTFEALRSGGRETQAQAHHRPHHLTRFLTTTPSQRPVMPKVVLCAGT